VSSYPIAIFKSFASDGHGWNLAFSEPHLIREGRDLASVSQLLHLADEESKAGRWVVLALAYETAPAFDPALKVHDAKGGPLIWMASFNDPSSNNYPSSSNAWTTSEWTPQVTRNEYAKNIARIRDLIAQGDTYQVNYTFPLHAHLHGDSFAGFEQLGRAQGAGYSVWLDLGRFHILSLSPELFFERHGSQIITRPMKGTLPRGRFLAEDEAQAAALKNSAKNRAENVMIVDMLRNDLAKVAIPGTVQTTQLFDVEKYRTVFQMTSTVEARLRPDTRLPDIFSALFPCASITGAPKVRTMEIIRELEPHPRGFYTGAIGFLQPNGDALFNVAIRTITLDTQTGAASCHVGGGITWDSTHEDEYQECLNKAAFLTAPPLTFDLLESILLDNGKYFLLEGHLKRFKESATYFAFPWPEDEVLTELETVRQSHSAGSWKVRLLLNLQGRLHIEAHPAPASTPVRIGLGISPIDSRNRMLFHKTTHRGLYENAQALRPDCDDVLLWNERGELTESTRANLVVELGGHRYTPPLDCGLLPGVFRSELLKTGQITERVLTKDDLPRAQAVYLINSVRKWIQAVCI
jgi:para-aminobenzoate synthetase/4-amino-4-deoxychorismate lyase